MAIKIAGVDVINDDRELVLAKLTDINSTINSTAVDVFIYDTSKDSDGGAWRHRTQHTSWYNEGASNTRSTRAEFPAVAVIVAEASKVTIYDGDDPSLPMWMVFQINFNEIIRKNGGYDVTCAACLNGQLAVGVENANNGLSVVNFVSDIGLNWTGSGKSNYLGTIAERDDALGFSTANSSESIVNGIVNDVAMTVLPDAPTDPATGLPVPTIAVATDGGLSVIKDDGTVVDLVNYASPPNSVAFVNVGGIAKLHTTSRYNNWINLFNIPSTDFNTGPYLWGVNFPTNGYASVFAETKTSLVSGWTKTLVQFQKDPALTNLNGGSTANRDVQIVNHITSTYNTGWMNGDIKLAALANTTAETLSGSELLSAFSDASWTTTSGEWTYDAANDEWDLVVSTAGTTGALNHDITVTEGSVYVVTATVSNITNVTANELFLKINNTKTGNLDLIKDDGSGDKVSTGGDGTYTVTFVAGASTPSFQIRAGSNSDVGDTATLVSASVRLADPDRSVNEKGLGVHGNITKAPVATGADVVAYSGFSSSNYLEQPYNDDLDFGTGDFCVMGWLKTSEVGNDYIVDCRNTAATVGFLVLVDANGVLYFSAQNAATGNVTGTVDVTSDTWRHFACVRSNSGTDYSIYVDGQLDTTKADTAEDVDSTDRILRIGTKVNGSLKFAGSLALLRISATVPTADQIAKIYEDEKLLFQPNAKATLYYDGTSSSPDAVTALAHDPVTDLLHVGTSSGRSVFQGLRRVDNTTTAVSTAISANDSLIVEQ